MAPIYVKFKIVYLDQSRFMYICYMCRVVLIGVQAACKQATARRYTYMQRWGSYMYTRQPLGELSVVVDGSEQLVSLIGCEQLGSSIS
jgi:hypothetical protein